LSLAAASIASIDILSLAEAEQGRDIDRFTTTRLVLNMGFRAITGDAIVAVGLMAIHEDVALGVKTPDTDFSADWPYWEEFMITNSVSNAQNIITRDIGGQRRLKGLEQQLVLKVKNRDSVSGIVFHVAGRMLVLIP